MSWLVVSVPALWGVSRTVQTALKLFLTPTAAVTTGDAPTAATTRASAP